jgi:hypothetical protein
VKNRIHKCRLSNAPINGSSTGTVAW